MPLFEFRAFFEPVYSRKYVCKQSWKNAGKFKFPKIIWIIFIRGFVIQNRIILVMYLTVCVLGCGLDFSFIRSVSNYHGNFHKKVDQNIIIGRRVESRKGHFYLRLGIGKGTYYLFDRLVVDVLWKMKSSFDPIASFPYNYSTGSSFCSTVGEIRLRNPQNH